MRHCAARLPPWLHPHLARNLHSHLRILTNPARPPLNPARNMDDSAGAKVGVSQIGLVGLAVMGQVGVACALVQDCQAAVNIS